METKQTDAKIAQLESLIAWAADVAEQSGRPEGESIAESMRALAAQRDEGIAAARWLLPFLVNEPRHLADAINRWPWLKEMAGGEG